jgi:cytochrome c-type biogenesis protein CcmF
MLSEIGFIALVVALLVAIYSAAISVWGARQKNDALVLSGRNAALTSVALVILSTLALWMSIINQDYQNAYVWSVSNPAMSDFFRVSALWGSQAGSLLFWSGIMAVFAGASILLNWRSHRRLMPYAIAYMMGIMIFFLFLSVVFENPFERWWVMPDLPANEQS